MNSPKAITPTFRFPDPMRLFSLLFFLPVLCLAQGTRMQNYPAASAVTADDIVIIADDPGGTPSTKKATMTVLESFLKANTATLTNKTISLGSNTLSGTLAQLNALVNDADVVSLAGMETLTNKTLATPAVTGAISFADDTRQTFNPGANEAGINVGSHAGDPGTLSNGDLWYNSTAGKLYARIAGTTTEIGGGGGSLADGDKGDIVVSGSGASWAVDSAVKSVGGNGSADNGKLVTYGNNGVLYGTGLQSRAYGAIPGSLRLEATGGTSSASISFSPAIGQTTSDVFRITGRGEGAPGVGYILTDSSNLDATKLVNEVALARIGQNSATSGQALAWNGTAWAPATITGASPGGSGSELQYRSGASTFGAVTGSSVSGGAVTLGTNGAASTPPLSLSGTWYTGGTSTTTKPQLLIEPSGTTSTSWSTNGTGLGVNAASGFAGNLLDLQVAGVSKAKVSSGGTFWALSSGAGYLLKRNDSSDPNTGVYSPATTTVGFVADNRAMFYCYGAGTPQVQVYAASGAYLALSASPHVGDSGDVRFVRAAANSLQLGSDHATTPTGQTVKAHDVTTGTGASLTLAGGKGSTAGGDLVLATSTTNGAATARLTVKASGVLNAAGMPTSSAGLASGDLWNDSGTVKIVP